MLAINLIMIFKRGWEKDKKMMYSISRKKKWEQTEEFSMEEPQSSDYVLVLVLFSREFK
jgi:hypothetical protein